jgi:hypothetical protein
VRETIAKANAGIAGMKERKDKTTYSEYFKEKEEGNRFNYLIKSQNDIGNYLASYFFA